MIVTVVITVKKDNPKKRNLSLFSLAFATMNVRQHIIRK
jgi:hypothetical protein